MVGRWNFCLKWSFCGGHVNFRGMYFRMIPPLLAIGKWNYAAMLVQLNSSSLFWWGKSCGECSIFLIYSENVGGNGWFPIWVGYFLIFSKIVVLPKNITCLIKKGKAFEWTDWWFFCFFVDGLWNAVVWTHDLFGWLLRNWGFPSPSE